MNENQLTIKEYEFDKPLVHKVDSMTDKVIRGCDSKCFHTFEYKCIINNKFTNVRNNESVNLTVAAKQKNLHGLNEKLKNTRIKGFLFNQINKLTIKIYSSLSNINIC